MIVLKLIGAIAPYVAMIYIIYWFIKDKIKTQKRIHELESENFMLLFKINQYTIIRRRFNTRPENSEELVDAVKFAMTQAHPDNPNGDKDRFIRYRRLYEHLKG